MRRSIVAGYCAYVVLASSEWLLQLALPSTLPIFGQQLFVLTIVLLAALLSKPGWSDINPCQCWPAVASGLLLFTLPSLLSPLCEQGLPAFTRVSLLALVPATVAVVTTSRERGSTDLTALLGPSLAGVAGVFFLLPASPELLLRRPMAAAAMGATVLSIAIGSYAAHTSTRHLHLRAALILLLAPSLAIISATLALTHKPFPTPTARDLPSLLWEAAELCLLVLLVQVLPPIALSTRYLLVPLLTSIEGCILLKPSLTLRMLFGIACLGVSSAILIKNSLRQPDSPTSLLR